MWEIIADPEEYGVEVIEAGMAKRLVAFADEDRKRWAEEVGIFASKLTGLAERAKKLQRIFTSHDDIMATPAALKTLKIQLFKVNEALGSALDLADKIQKEIVKK